tara:strand:- start:33 stop:155 length:123 start_codon:yes stop_codon:yes gene_type:complete
MHEENSSGKVNVFPENPELCLSIELKAVWPWFYSYEKRGT